MNFAKTHTVCLLRNAMSKENSTGAPSSGEPSLESLDDCGLRFLLAKKQYMYLKHCLPMAQRKNLQKQGMSKKSLRLTLCFIKIPKFLISRIEQFKPDLGIPLRKWGWIIEHDSFSCQRNTYLARAKVSDYCQMLYIFLLLD